MANTIGSLVIDLVANTAKFSSSLESAVKTVESTAAKFVEAFETIGVSLSIEAVSGFVLETAELGKQLEKSASSAGIAQGQFNQLSAAFAESGVSAESLSRGLKNMQVAIAGATAAGGKELAKDFNDIGLSAASLKNQAPDVQLLAIAEALSRISDPVERAAAGTKILGRQFLELEPELLKGADGLEKIIEAAHGLSVEDTEKLAKFSDEMDHLGAAIKLFAAGAVADVANGFNQLSELASSDLTARINKLQLALSNPGNYDDTRLESMRKELAALQAQANTVIAQSDKVKTAIGEQGRGDIEASGKTVLDDQVLAFEVQLKAAALRAQELDEEDKQTQTIGDKRVAFEQKVNDLFNAGRINRTEAFKRDDQEDNKKQDALDKVAAATAISDSIKETQDQWHESFAAMTEDARVAQENSRAEFEKTREIATQAADSIENAFAEFLFNPFQGGLKKLLLSWVQTLGQMVAKAESANIFKALFGSASTGGGLGGILSGLLSGASSTAVSYVPAADGIVGLATGGSFMVGGTGGTDSQLVQFKASPNERVTVTTPGQHAGGGAGGGMTIVNNNYIDARTDQAQIAQLIGQSTRSAVQQATAKVTNLIHRGAFVT